MKPTFYYEILTVVIVALITFMTRLLPFLVFGRKKEVPKAVDYLGKVLPPAIMATLVIYCLKTINLLHFPNGIAEITGVVVTAAVHIWKKNTLLSIGTGTVLYMLLIRFI